MKSGRIGVLGGTFNPIHNLHLKLAEYAYEQLNLETVMLIPSGISYLKAGTDVLDAGIRYKMCLLASKELPYIEVSDIEIKRAGNSYTCDTLKELLGSAPDNEFFLIVGADTLFMLEKWKNPEYIFANSIIAVAARLDGDRYTDDKIREKIGEYGSRYGARTEIINIDISDLSSSMIRKKASEGEDIRPFVPESVAAYIAENGLYR